MNDQKTCKFCDADIQWMKNYMGDWKCIDPVSGEMHYCDEFKREQKKEAKRSADIEENNKRAVTKSRIDSGYLA